MLTVGSLFSGIGGIELGLERTGGFKTIWFVEKDEYCQAILRKHWPEIPIYGDIKRVNFDTLARPDMLTGGFPCQPTSTAGKRKGAEDPRWLWPEYARAIRLLRPRLILVENPPNLLNFNREFGQVLGDLAECGYDAEWQSICASDVGAPHRRERTFLIAYSEKVGCFSGRESNKVLPDEVGGLGFEGCTPDADFNTSRCREDQPYIFPWKQNSERILTTDINSERAQGNSEGKVRRFPEFSCFKNIRCVTDLFNRSDVPEPLIRRGHDGFANRLYKARIASLGNAVVPQVAEIIGEMIQRALN